LVLSFRRTAAPAGRSWWRHILKTWLYSQAPAPSRLLCEPAAAPHPQAPAAGEGALIAQHAAWHSRICTMVLHCCRACPRRQSGRPRLGTHVEGPVHVQCIIGRRGEVCTGCGKLGGDPRCLLIVLLYWKGRRCAREPHRINVFPKARGFITLRRAQTRTTPAAQTRFK
jgi:hypothetical protein